MIVIWKSEFAGDADCRGGAIFADYSKNLYIINNSFVPHSYLFSNIYGVHLVMVENSTIHGNRFVDSVKCYPSAAFGGYCKGAAIYLDRSKGNKIVRNIIYLPSREGMEYAAEVYGMYIFGVNNSIYLNDFYGKEVPYYPDTATGFYYIFPRLGSENTFHSPKIVYKFGNTTFEGFLGNYWYSNKGLDNDGDGITDGSFLVDEYPLILSSENYEIIGLVKEDSVLNTSSPIASSSQEEENFEYISFLVVIGLVLISLWKRK